MSFECCYRFLQHPISARKQHGDINYGNKAPCGAVVFVRIDVIHFLIGCCNRRLNWGQVRFVRISYLGFLGHTSCPRAGTYVLGPLRHVMICRFSNAMSSSEFSVLGSSWNGLLGLNVPSVLVDSQTLMSPRPIYTSLGCGQYSLSVISQTHRAIYVIITRMATANKTCVSGKNQNEWSIVW